MSDRDGAGRIETVVFKPVKESGRKSLDPGSHVQRVLTGSDGKVEDDAVTLNDEKGEISYVVQGRDAEHVTAILEQPRRDSLMKHP